MTSKLETKKQNILKERSIWSKIRQILLYGISIYFGFLLLAIIVKYVRDGTLTLLEDAVMSLTMFLLIVYWRIIEIESCSQKLSETFSPQWRRAARTFYYWLYVFVVWFVLLLIRQLLPSQLLKIDFSLLDMFLFYMLYALSSSLCIFSSIVYSQASRYLSLPEVKAQKRKKVADALTMLTPALGFPWLIAVSLVLSFVNIPIEPYWIIYIVFISIYVVFFALFIDLPYSVNTKAIKKQKMDKLQKERNKVLEKIEEIDNDTQESLLKKIVFESEIARIDREREEIKSESIHPYKIVIPLASFSLGIFAAIFIDFVKNIFQLI